MELTVGSYVAVKLPGHDMKTQLIGERQSSSLIFLLWKVLQHLSHLTLVCFKGNLGSAGQPMVHEASRMAITNMV